MHVRPVPWRELDRRGGAPAEASAAVRARVLAARERQAKRLASLLPGAGVAAGGGQRALTNAAIPAQRIDEAVDALPDARALLGRAVERFALSARAAHRCLRVARTVADLAGESRVTGEAMAEAVGLRAGA